MNSKNHTTASRLIGLITAIALTTPAWASPVPIVNPGFEAQTLADGATATPITGWTNVAGGASAFNPTATQFTNGSAEGNNVASIYEGADGAGISQILAGDLGKLQINADYVLTVKVGDSKDASFDGYKIQLRADGNLLAEDDNTVVAIDDDFVTATVNYTYNAGLHSALVGQPLEIRLLGKNLGAGTGEVVFDDVQLTVALFNPIADPGSYSIFVSDSLSLDGSNSQPSDGETITTYEWDLNNDGLFDELVTGATPAAIPYATLTGTHSMSVGLNTIKLRVTDSASLTSTVEGTVEIKTALLWDANAATAGQTDGAGTWLNANQWWNGSANVDWSNSPPDNAVIGNGGTGGTITLGAVTAGSVMLDNFTGTYTLSGTSLDQSDGVTVGSTAGAVTINSIISGTGGLTMAGTGSLTLSNASNSFSGQLSIENGELFRQGSINNKSANGVFGNSTLPIILGASSQTGRLSIANDGGLSTNKDFTLAAGGTGQIRFGNFAPNFNITNADRSLTLSGSIGGSGNLVKLGGAAVILSGSNNYSGTTTVNEGTLRLSNATALPGGIAETGGTSALTIHGNGTINVGAVLALTAASGDFKRDLGTGVDEFQIPGGISGFEASGSARQVIVNNVPAFELQWGIPTFNPSILLFGYHPQTATGALTLQNKIDLNGSTRTIEVRNNTATLSNEIRTSSGTAGLIKTGAGTLVLSGANTYNGATTISGGTLTVSNAATFTNTSVINLAAGARLEVSAANSNLTKLVAGGGVPFGSFLRYSSQTQTAAGSGNGPGTILGTVELNLTNVNPDYTLDFGSGSTFQNLVTATYTSPITLSGDASLLSSTAVFTLNTGGITASTAGTKTLALTGTNAGANTVNSVIGNGSGTIAVAKTGGGSWTLAGANTYSGATTVSAGTLTLSGADGAIGSSAVTVAGGTLTIANTGAANNGDRLSNSSAFTMNGGTFNYNNTAGLFDYSESAGTLTIVGGANTVAIQQAAVAQTSTLTFAGLSRTAGAINFTGAGLGAAVDPRSKITFTSAPTLTDGIIGTWATINGTDYASLDGNDLVAYGGAMTDLTRQSSGTKVIPDTATADIRIIEGTGGSPANLTLAATTTTIDTILNSTSGGSGATTINIASGETLGVNSINSVPNAGALTLGTAVDTGTLTPATAGGNLLLINSSTAVANNMIVNSVIANNTSASTVTKDGAGVLRLTGTNTYSGGTIINAGTLVVKADTNLGAAGTGVTFNGSGALSFGNHPATTGATIDLGTRPIAINNNAVAGLYHNWANGTTTISGAITGNGGIIWGRDPVLTFSGGDGFQRAFLLSTANTFTGPLTIGVGNENIGVASYFRFNSLGNSSNPITLNRGSIAFEYNSGAIANLTLDRPIVLGDSATLTNLSTFALTYNGPLLTSGTGTRTLNLSTSTGVSTFGGVIANGSGQQVGVTKSGSGTWRLSGNNTYSGQTTINDGGGTLIFQNASQSVSASSKLWIGGSAGMTLLDDGSGTINLGNNVDVGVAGTGERDGPTIFVGNNNTANGGNSSGTTTGSTIALGTFNLTYGDARSSQILRIRGADGYRLQLGGLTLAKRADHSNPQIEPTTAPVTIAGPVIQASGKLATDSTNSDTLDLTGTATGNLISGVIQDAADYPANPNAKPLNILKSSTSVWTFSGDNSYTGTTTVSAGTLIINGDQSSASGAVAVNGTSSLGGSGTIGGNVTVAAGANLRPGASAGTLSIGGNLNISAQAGGAGKLFYELDTIAASDKIAVTGTLNIGSGTLGLSDFDLSDLGGLQNGTYTLISSGGLTGTLDAANVNGTLGLATIQLQISGDNVVLAVSGLAGGDPEIAVEEPATFDIANNGSRDFGTVTIGSDNSLTFTIRNTGTTDLNLTGMDLVDVSGTNEADFTVTANPDTPVAASDTTTFTVQFAPGGAGVRNAVLTIANNDSDEDPFIINVSGTGQTIYEEWADGAGFGGDENGDGVSNGLAFLLGAADADANALGLLPEVSENDGDLILEFDCLASADRGDAVLSLQFSNDLGDTDSWTTTEVPGAAGNTTVGSVSFVATVNGDLIHIVATIDASEADGGKLFSRLQATE